MAEEKGKPEPGAGDVIITLAGKEHTMRPTLEACMAISKLAGGAQNVLKRCFDQDFDMLVDVISIGTGYTSLKERQLIQQAVYETGTIRIAGDCMLFVRIVNNGGRLPDDGDDEGGGHDTDAPLSPSESSIAA